MKTLTLLLSIPLLGCVVDDDSVSESTIESEVTTIESVANANGHAATISRTGAIDRTNPFFKVRFNGRTCGSCHDTLAGWGITPQLAQSKFATNPSNVMFLPFDASNNPNADHSTTAAKQQRYSLLLQRGLTRFDIRPGDLGQYTDIVFQSVTDPYGYSTQLPFPQYRRASSIANEVLAQTLVFDGINVPARPLLEAIAVKATEFHLQATARPALTSTETVQIADFMASLVHAQTHVTGAGRLDEGGAFGGVTKLAETTFVAGANDPTQPGFNKNVFQLYGAWLTSTNAVRASIARGERVFNTKHLPGVAMLFPSEAIPTTSTCSTCHAVPNVGNHPVFRVFDIGTADPALSAGVLPIAHLRDTVGTQFRSVTDLGHATRSGKFRDLGKFAVPKLRGLSSRAPYFHNGMAADLRAVVAHYERKLGVVFSGTERDDLIAFLSAL